MPECVVLWLVNYMNFIDPLFEMMTVFHCLHNFLVWTLFGSLFKCCVAEPVYGCTWILFWEGEKSQMSNSSHITIKILNHGLKVCHFPITAMKAFRNWFLCCKRSKYQMSKCILDNVCKRFLLGNNLVKELFLKVWFPDQL
jgi:hypothetical protein